MIKDSPNNTSEINRPFVPVGSHPIETGRYLIGTEEINRLYEVVTQWIENRVPGGIVSGRPRLGKSRAISYLMHILPADYNNRLSIFDLSSYQNKAPSEKSFYEDILSGVGHDLVFKGSTSEKRVRLVRYLIEHGIRLDNRRIVFFMDDAQRLSELQYNCLMDVYNDLDKVGIQLTVILVGQPELLHQRSAFIRTKKTQIVGRFMSQDHEFTGIQNPEDLKYCLTGFDQESEYPNGSGWSFTQYYFPDAFKDGQRFEKVAGTIFEMFMECTTFAGIRKVDIPMQYLMLTIEYACKRFGASGANNYWPTNAQWKMAIESSGYITAELLHESVTKK
ncbi:ATP-binding protein [Paenibacillus sp. MMS18-CY102]|uniref:ATP-binding protein n=1 Tax=Paenibacillus sp. MMS18-CY102 TaxID=2682849 RepID=UPI00136541B4|nr:ATP-binding protein [Paenibacillus sp. MMS18-CY102]MWC31377.1 AAA family ATPase [Paenibacillus sp. MMS18-CY102]